MPTVIPPTASQKVEFFTSHVPVWAQDPVGIGTSAENVALVQEKLDVARAALVERAQAVQAARSATQRLRQALAELDRAGAQVVGEVKAKAKVAGSTLYAKAWIRPPAAPSPIGRPGTPTGLARELLPNGSLHLTWTCRHPRGAKGTMYQVYRASGVNGEFAFLGATGKKKFTDATVPAGTRTLVYRIVAVRSTSRGEGAEFLVRLGVSDTAPAASLQLRRDTPAAA